MKTNINICIFLMILLTGGLCQSPCNKNGEGQITMNGGRVTLHVKVKEEIEEIYWIRQEMHYVFFHIAKSCTFQKCCCQTEDPKNCCRIENRIYETKLCSCTISSLSSSITFCNVTSEDEGWFSADIYAKNNQNSMCTFHLHIPGNEQQTEPPNHTILIVTLSVCIPVLIIAVLIIFKIRIYCKKKLREQNEVPVIYRCSTATASRHLVEVISAEETGVILPINVTGVREIYWIFDKTHIATTKANGRIEVKNNKFKGRLHCVDGGSLKIDYVTRKDQGTYTANVLEVHQQFHLKVYPVLLNNDINIRANVTNNGTCSLALTCLANDSNVTIFWSYPNTSDLYISGRKLHIYNVYPNITYKCTAKNLVSNVSKSVTPWQFCHKEGHTSHLQMDEFALKWIVLATTVLIITLIIIIFLSYKKLKSRNIGALR